MKKTIINDYYLSDAKKFIKDQKDFYSEIVHSYNTIINNVLKSGLTKGKTAKSLRKFNDYMESFAESSREIGDLAISEISNFMTQIDDIDQLLYWRKEGEYMDKFFENKKLNQISNGTKVIDVVETKYSDIESAIFELNKLKNMIKEKKTAVPKMKGSGYFSEKVNAYCSIYKKVNLSLIALIDNTVEFLREYLNDSKNFDISKSSTLKK